MIFVALLTGFLWLNSVDAALVRVDFSKEGVPFATSAHKGEISGTRYSPDRAFLPSNHFGKRYWQSASFSQFPQIIYFKFEKPRAISMVSFDACTADLSGCQQRETRQATGPKDFEIVAAFDCDQYGEDVSWSVRESRSGQRWTGRDGAIDIIISGWTRFKCWGIRVLDVEGEDGDDPNDWDRRTTARPTIDRRTTVSNIEMNVIRCDKPVVDMNEWNCEHGDLEVGDVCQRICPSSLTSHGKTTCKRDGWRDLDGHFQGKAICEFHCSKPAIEEGYLSSCERPIEGATCRVQCNQGGYNDLGAITCKPHNKQTNWRITGGKNGNHDHDHSKSIVCVTPQDVATCAESTRCAVRLPEKATLDAYLAGKAVRRYAIVVSYADWSGALPATCPADVFASSSSSCGGNLCHVVMRGDGPLPETVDLGTEQTIGGCVNRKLRLEEGGEKRQMTTVAVMKMADGNVRQVVILAAPNDNGTPGWLIAVIVVAVVVGFVGIAVYFAKRRGGGYVPGATKDPDPVDPGNE